MFKIYAKLFCFQWLSLTAIKFAQGVCPSIKGKGCPPKFVGFYFYQAKDVSEHQFLIDDPTTMNNLPYNSNAEIKFIIHGSGGNRNDNGMESFRKLYYRRDFRQIIILDYKKLATPFCYIQAVKNLPYIAECGAKFIQTLLKHRNDLHINKFHVIGFSLGAHIAAIIANNLKSSNLRFRRITGLDPAYPVFFPGWVGPNGRLSRIHADFVDVIHANAGRAGVKFSNAHLDVYANNGIHQPGCSFFVWMCSHITALDIYLESIITDTGFYARKCHKSLSSVFSGKCLKEKDDNIPMIRIGEDCDRPSEENEGIYAFRTNRKYPRAVGPTVQQLNKLKSSSRSVVFQKNHNHN